MPVHCAAVVCFVVRWVSLWETRLHSAEAMATENSIPIQFHIIPTTPQCMQIGQTLQQALYTSDVTTHEQRTTAQHVSALTQDEAGMSYWNAKAGKRRVYAGKR